MDGQLDLLNWTAPARYPDAPGFWVSGGTSEEAARKIAGLDEALRIKCLMILDLGEPLTPDQIAKRFGLKPTNVRPRTTQLCRKGLIIDTETTRLNDDNNPCIVYCISALGREALRQNRAKIVIARAR